MKGRRRCYGLECLEERQERDWPGKKLVGERQISVTTASAGKFNGSDCDAMTSREIE